MIHRSPRQSQNTALLFFPTRSSPSFPLSLPDFFASSFLSRGVSSPDPIRNRQHIARARGTGVHHDSKVFRRREGNRNAIVLQLHAPSESSNS